MDGQACEADDDEDDEAVQQEELQEFVDEETEAEGEYLQIVQTIEDLASEKQRLESMLCEGETAVETVEEASSAIIPAEAQRASASNVSTADGEACEATQITQRSEPPARTWTSLVHMCSQSQEFVLETPDDLSIGGCVKRMRILEPLMQDLGLALKGASAGKGHQDVCVS